MASFDASSARGYQDGMQMHNASFASYVGDVMTGSLRATKSFYANTSEDESKTENADTTDSKTETEQNPA
jgi:hypothetical protein